MEPIKILLIVSDEEKRIQLRLFLEEQGLLDQSIFVDINQLGENVFKNDFFNLLIVDLSNLKLSINQLVEKMRKSNESFVDSSMPLLVIDGVTEDKDEFSRNVNHNRIAYLADLLSFDKLKMMIQKLVPPSVSLEFLHSIAKISMPDPEVFISKLIKHFKDLVPGKINEIEKMFQSHSFEDISKMAHLLQSVCYNVGANYFAEILKELETSSKKGFIQKNGVYWRAKLENEFQKTISSLDNILKNKTYMKK